MKKYSLLIVGIVFLFALAGSALAAQLQEVVEQSFPLAEDGSVSVENVAGEILIHAWDEDKVKMVATKWARALRGTDDVRTFFETIEEEMEIPAYEIPV